MAISCLKCKYFATSVDELPCCHCKDNHLFEPSGFVWDKAKSARGQAIKRHYIDTDIALAAHLYAERPKYNPYVTPSKAAAHRLRIKNVIFNEPATIVFWADGTKTVVKCRDDDKFDPEKGLAMAITKKALGNNYDYYNQIKHWLKKYEPESKLNGYKAAVHYIDEEVWDK